MKKLDSLSYFPLAATLALSSAVLELLASESPIFRFLQILGPRTPRRISETVRPISTKVQDMTAHLSAQKK